jgi:hypothetical protein
MGSSNPNKMRQTCGRNIQNSTSEVRHGCMEYKCTIVVIVDELAICTSTFLRISVLKDYKAAHLKPNAQAGIKTSPDKMGCRLALHITTARIYDSLHAACDLDGSGCGGKMRPLVFPRFLGRRLNNKRRNCLCSRF